MKIEIYGMNSYDRSGKIRWLLTELGQEFEDHWIETDEDYEKLLEINPLGQVPVVAIDGKLLTESGAICAYLADQFSDKGLAPAVGYIKRAEYEELLYLGITIGSLSPRIQIIEDIPEGALKEKKMIKLLEELNDIVQYISGKLGNKDYLLNKFSSADVFIGYHFYYASLWPELNEIIESSNIVSQYMKRLKGRAAAIACEVFSYEE